MNLIKSVLSMKIILLTSIIQQKLSNICPRMETFERFSGGPFYAFSLNLVYMHLV